MSKLAVIRFILAELQQVLKWNLLIIDVSTNNSLTMENNQSESHLPNTRILAFIDILGFKNIVNSMNSNRQLYDSLLSILIKINQKQKDHYEALDRLQRQGLEEEYNFRHSMEFTAFSDSIIISKVLIPQTGIILFQLFLSTIQNFISELLEMGIFVRGGISIGWTYHKDNIVFGDGLIRSYELESSKALYPRIILDDNLMNHKFPLDYMQISLSEMHQNSILRDSDGYWYLDPFYSLVSGNHVSFPDYLRFIEVKNKIELELKNTHKDSERILSKIQWLAIKFNEAIKRNLEYYGFDKIEEIHV